MSIQIIKELREKTGAGILDCKLALKESENDLSKAIDFLRRKGLAGAVKKSGRTTEEGGIGSYIHAGGKIGVLLEVNCETDFVARNTEFQTLVKDIAMQVAGSIPPPRYLSEEDIPEDVIVHERAIFVAQAKETKKPESVVEKIADGKVKKFIQEVCLLDQAFIKDPKITIRELIAEKISKTGENIQVRRFTRYQLGEHIEGEGRG
ncbi:MAG: translation elongation factor Ts [Nitrospiria bacterium]